MQVEQIEAVCLIKVDDERANAFSTALIQALSEEIAMAEANEEIGAVVIAGNQKAFFAGFDLGIIGTGDREKIVEMTSAGGALIQVAVVNAKLMTSDLAVDAGFLDEVVAADKVEERALEVAQGFAMDLDSKSYEKTVKAMRSSVLNEMDSGVAADRAAAGLST